MFLRPVNFLVNLFCTDSSILTSVLYTGDQTGEQYSKIGYDMLQDMICYRPKRSRYYIIAQGLICCFCNTKLTYSPQKSFCSPNAILSIRPVNSNGRQNYCNLILRACLLSLLVKIINHVATTIGVVNVKTVECALIVSVGSAFQVYYVIVAVILLSYPCYSHSDLQMYVS